MIPQATSFNRSIKEVEKKLKTSFYSGLSEEEVKVRQAKYGLNEFWKKKGKSLFRKFLAQFQSFMIIILLIAAIISGVVGVHHGEGFTDAIIILSIVIINAIIKLSLLLLQKNLESCRKEMLR